MPSLRLCQGARTNNGRIVFIYQIDPWPLARIKDKKFQIAYAFLANESRLEHESERSRSEEEMVERAAKKAEERAKRMAQTQMNDSRFNAIQNEGQMIERKPLTAWETFAHALLLSNEAAYVN